MLNTDLSYYTTEHDTGKKWIDGKIIYRKVFEVNSITSGYNIDNTTISNIDTVVSYGGIAHLPVNQVEYLLPSVSADGFLELEYSKAGGFYYRSNSAYANSYTNVRLFVEYTKTS